MNAPAVQPRERGILFSAPMVRALLAGAKTQTRRAIKPQPEIAEVDVYGEPVVHPNAIVQTSSLGSYTVPRRCPYGEPGDRLWVRETHAQFCVGEGLDRAVPQCVAYRATCDEDGGFDYYNGRGEVMRLKVTKWTPAIHMPRFASRLLLEITAVRVERLLDISEDDAIAEGCAVVDPSPHSCARDVFSDAWRSINGSKSWDANPWVWAITFRRVAPS